MRIELSLLEQLVSVAHYGSLSAASAATHLTQPTLSRSMQKLEREIGAPVFERKKNKIVLNENGQIAIEYANRIQGAWQYLFSMKPHMPNTSLFVKKPMLI
jgi:DNA-binding transcriptional LysR family regulator